MLHSLFGIKKDDESRQRYAEFLSERIYGGVTLVAINVGLLHGVDHITTLFAFKTVVTAIIGLWAASLFGEYVSHRVVHDKPMPQSELRRSIIVHRGILVAAIPTVIFLGLAALDIIDLHTALIIDISLALTGIALLLIRSAYTHYNTITDTIVSITLQAVVASIIIGVKLLSH